jgi:hypothetical protein
LLEEIDIMNTAQIEIEEEIEEEIATVITITARETDMI